MQPSKTKPNTRTKVHVQLLYGQDAETYRQNYLAGKAPSETPYDFHRAREEGFDVSFSRDAVRNPKSFVSRFLGRIFEFDVLHAWSNRDRIRRADVIWTLTEGEAFATAFLFSLGIIPCRPIVANSVWLLNYWKWTRFHKRAVCRYLSRYITVLTVHSKECLPVAKRVFPETRTQLVYFGINTVVFKLTAPGSGPTVGNGPVRIFSAGTDRTRDFETLLAAFGNDGRFRLTIISGRLSEDQIKQYRNVVLIRPSSMAEFLRCYQEADIVAVPMKENIFSGITVALEAVAMGKPVLSSRTGGVPTYFEEEDVFYVPVGDATAMREVVISTDHASRRLRAESAQSRFIERDYSSRALIRRYAELTRDLLHPRCISLEETKT
jgi:glycosyltransferase involved in cell wall biosynthesis